MQVVKLGGSVITAKGRLRTFRQSNALRLAREMAGAGDDLVVVHGAGSFGHIKAKEHDIAGGFKRESQLPAVAEVQRDVRDLNMRVMDVLEQAGMSPVSMPPGATCEAKKGKVSTIHPQFFREYLDMGLTPVTFGDVVLDRHTRFSICSGDQLLYLLAKELQPKRAVFAADVDGVFTGDPKTDPKATLIRELDRDTIKRMGAGKGRVTDVTGSMKAKAEMVLSIADLGVEVWIVNGNVPGRVQAALSGKKVMGTRAGGKKGIGRRR